MTNNTTHERDGAPHVFAVSRGLARSNATVRIPLVLLAAALSIAVTTPAHATTASADAAMAPANAATASADCILKVQKPISGGIDIFTGNRLVKYKVTVKCPSLVPVYVQVQQRWYARDNDSRKQRIGSKTSFQFMPIGGEHTFTVNDRLRDLRAGREKVSQEARFWAVNRLPAPSNITYGPWKSSAEASLRN